MSECWKLKDESENGQGTRNWSDMRVRKRRLGEEGEGGGRRWILRTEEGGGKRCLERA